MMVLRVSRGLLSPYLYISGFLRTSRLRRGIADHASFLLSLIILKLNDMRTIAVLLTMLLFLPVNAQRNETGGGWYVEGYNDTKARNYLDNNYYLDKVEGIWQSNDGYKYAIVKDVVDGMSSSTRFRMIILESSFNGWRPTEIKAFIEKGSIPTVYSMKYYVKAEDRTGLSSENIFLAYENQLMMSFKRLNGDEISLYKLYPEVDKIDELQKQDEVVEEEIAEWTGTCFAIGKIGW